MVLSDRQTVIFCTEVRFIRRAIQISANGSANHESPCSTFEFSVVECDACPSLKLCHTRRPIHFSVTMPVNMDEFSKSR